MPKNYRYISNNLRTLFVIYSFWVFIILSAVVSMIGVYALVKFNIAMREQTDITREAFLYVMNNYDTASDWLIIILILCPIVFLFWIYRASVNTHALYPQTKIEFSPGWCVGSYFLPIFNLYWPYKSMKELWILNVKKEKSIILIWWILYLVSSCMMKFTSKLVINNHSDFMEFTLFDVASTILEIICAVIVIKIVTEINKAQVNRLSYSLNATVEKK